MTQFPTALIIFLPMLIEALRARRNERQLRARGGIEPKDDVYAVMRVAYPASFATMLFEGVVRGTPAPGVVAAGLVLFAVAKCLKWWAILSLGPLWSFRVIVVPGDRRVTTGPYRHLRHPNYVGVVGELAGAALLTQAVIAGPVSLIVFGGLLWRRIGVEEATLRNLDRP